MKIEVIRRIDFSELERKVREVPLRGKDFDGKEIRVYEHAHISLRTMHPDEVNPTTFYLLRSNLEFQRALREHLMSTQGIDTLNLEGALEILNEKGELWTLTPPIIEVTPRLVRYQPKEGEIYYRDVVKVQIPIINDGAHRIALARELGILFRALFISGADENFPFYAHPNEWSRTKVVDFVPSDKRDKKFYSREDCYALYRDFGVLGCGAPRILGSKS